jgi:phospholipid/cholesterol/gamma-HCH transport system permease protein
MKVFYAAFAEVGRATLLLRDTAQEMADHMMGRRLPFRLAHLFEQTDRAGVGSVPLIALISCFLGLTMALLTGYQLEKYGQRQLVPTLVAIGFNRELGPLMTGIMVAARIGAAYTAELGTMTVAEEVEAIQSMGIGPRRYLVGPRLTAVFFLMPCLSVVSILSALIGGAVISKWAFDISLASFSNDVIDSLLLKDVVSGMLKSLMFGLIIGLVACSKGLHVRGGAAGVGDATTSSVVTAITSVIGSDTLFNIVLVALTGT